MKKLAYLLLSITFYLLPCEAFAFTKSNVSVLYVGGTSNFDNYGRGVDSLRLSISVAAREASFKALLESHFNNVKCIDAKDYNWKMSDGYDVTIMDGRPAKLSEGRGKYDRAQYIPVSFSRPMITIAEQGEFIGQYVGSKNDWYCLCLDADAHHTNFDHAIFKGPFPVTIKTTMKPTPATAFEYQFEYSEPIPKELPMWSVQSKGYGSTPGYRVGMVSRNDGYLDSPETEYISSGVCAKSPDAIALGRHGNYFTWGFSADPQDMTPEGREVFCNVVAYMAQFAGQTPIARKFNERISPRSYMDATLYLCNPAGYADYKKTIEGFNAQSRHQKDSLQNVVDNGGTISQMEEEIMSYPDMEIPSYEQFLQQQMGKDFEKFKTNTDAYAKYMKENRPYMYANFKQEDVTIDEDCKSLKIANNDKRILQKAISMFPDKKAKRILERYTLCRFKTKKEWQNWYKKYQDKLFFTESGGYLWLVNSREPGVVGNDYSVLDPSYK